MPENAPTSGGAVRALPIPQGQASAFQNAMAPQRAFKKFGSLTKCEFQEHPSFPGRWGYAPTLTLPRRDRELIEHPLSA